MEVRHIVLVVMALIVLLAFSSIHTSNKHDKKAPPAVPTEQVYEDDGVDCIRVIGGKYWYNPTCLSGGGWDSLEDEYEEGCDDNGCTPLGDENATTTKNE